MLETILLSITQGITEFLPVSSSAHLILISQYLNFNNENLVFDISLHLGSLLAVILFFNKEIINFLQNKSLFIKIIISSLPTMLIGFLLIKLNLIGYFRNTYVISCTTIIFGLLLYFSDKSRMERSINHHFSLRDAIYIGFFQTLSLIPGVSRSGITITCARFLKFDRINSAKISFLLSIPTLMAISAYNIFKIIELKNFQLAIQNYWAIFFSFVFSLLTLKILLKFLKKFSYIFFVIYRIFLGAVIILYVR